ncbi:MAG: hypothetical protein Q7R96_03275, partial [Nanoarchaeota archaeon]|nr:hypothetical protein [Nanoarchaeota archaeon]
QPDGKGVIVIKNNSGISLKQWELRMEGKSAITEPVNWSGKLWPSGKNIEFHFNDLTKDKKGKFYREEFVFFYKTIDNLSGGRSGMIEVKRKWINRWFTLTS